GANDAGLGLVDRDMVGAAIGIQIGEQPPMASLRSRHEQQRTEAYERQRPDDAGSRGHAGGWFPAVWPGGVGSRGRVPAMASPRMSRLSRRRAPPPPRNDSRACRRARTPRLHTAGLPAYR